MKAESPVEPLLTREEVAAWLKIRPKEVARLGVTCIELSHKTRRYRRTDVEHWLDTQRTLTR